MEKNAGLKKEKRGGVSGEKRKRGKAENRADLSSEEAQSSAPCLRLAVCLRNPE